MSPLNIDESFLLAPLPVSSWRKSHVQFDFNYHEYLAGLKKDSAKIVKNESSSIVIIKQQKTKKIIGSKKTNSKPILGFLAMGL